MRITSFSQALPAPSPTLIDRVSSAPASRAESARPDDQVHDERLRAVVEMIKRLTGRDVELVPPSPYLVSGPSRPEPVELKVVDHKPRTPRSSKPVDAAKPVRVDITDVVERGTSPRMQLVAAPDGALSLHPELDIDV